MIDARDSQTTPKAYGDPSIVQILGLLSEVLGLAEQIRRVLPLQRITVARRHKRIAKQLDESRGRLEDCRAAVRLLSSAISEHLEGVPSDAVGVVLPISEIPILRRGLRQLQDSVKQLTNLAYDLEGDTEHVPSEVERFYRISAAGGPVLDAIRHAFQGEASSLPSLLTTIESYLTETAALLSTSNRGRQ